MGDDVRPTWLIEPCPTWCRRDHQETDHPEDRFHQSEVAVLTVLAGARSIPPPRDLGVTEIVVRMGQQPGAQSAWVEVTAAEGQTPALTLSRDSAITLANAILTISDVT